VNHQGINSYRKREEIGAKSEKIILDKLSLRPKIDSAKSAKRNENKDVSPNKIYVAVVCK
jgi:hypothetical protein